MSRWRAWTRADVPPNTGASISVTVEDLDALKALIFRPEAVIVKTGQAAGTWQWVASDTTTADDALVVECTSGTAGRYKRIVDDLARPMVEWFGALPLTETALIARSGSVSAEIAANDAAFAAGLAYLKALGGGSLIAPGQFYVLSERLERPANVYIKGAGVGEWEPIYPQRAKTWGGTTLLFKGTGTREITFDGITSCEHGGGWIEDPDSGGSYFKLWSAYDDDATGTTPATQREFSAAIMPETDAKYGGLWDLRIVNWIGTDGITDWSNTGSSSLGDEWDIGYLLKNNEYEDSRNVQIVGGWREFAHLQCTTAITNSHSERNSFDGCKFQGRRGRGIRAPDEWKVTASTANSLTIRWSSELFWASGGGTFRGSNGTTYTYTGVTHSGTDADFVFTGVTPDPSSLTSGTSIRFPSSGFANGQYINCYTYGLDHQSGDRASDFSLSDSKSLEVSGYIVRGIKEINSKAWTAEPVVAHWHNCADATYISSQFEGGGHLIASPERTEQAAAAAIGDTRNLMIIGGVGVEDQDVRLFEPRSGRVDETQIHPRSDLTGDLGLRPLRDGRAVVTEDFDGTAFMRHETQTWTPGFRFVTVTMGTQTGSYVQIGKLVFFNLSISWSSLDTTDTSAIGITLPVVADLTVRPNVTLQTRTATGWSLTSLTSPFFDITSDGHLGLSHNVTNRVLYSTASVLSAAGNAIISGSYVAA